MAEFKLKCVQFCVKIHIEFEISQQDADCVGCAPPFCLLFKAVYPTFQYIYMFSEYIICRFSF